VDAEQAEALAVREARQQQRSCRLVRGKVSHVLRSGHRVLPVLVAVGAVQRPPSK